MGVEQSANFGEEGGLDRACVDIVAKGLHVRAKILVEVFQGAVIGNQNTDVHLVCDALGAEALEILAYSHVRLANLIWF